MMSIPILTQNAFNSARSGLTLKVASRITSYNVCYTKLLRNSAFGHYLLQRNMWNGMLMNIEQNGLKENFNTVKLTTKKEDNISYILFGGSAKVKIDGNYFL